MLTDRSVVNILHNNNNNESDDGPGRPAEAEASALGCSVTMTQEPSGVLPAGVGETCVFEPTFRTFSASEDSLRINGERPDFTPLGTLRMSPFPSCAGRGEHFWSVVIK